MAAINTNLSVSQLVSIGGREWIKDEMHRVYFNAETLLAKEWSTGPRYGIEYNGEQYSASKGRAILSALRECKVWIDVDTGDLHTKLVPIQGIGRDGSVERIELLIEEALESKLARVTT